MHVFRRQQLGQVAVHAAGIRPHAVCKCRHDCIVRAQPAAAAITAGHGHQQCLQHACYGTVGTSAVCRTHHTTLGSGYPAGHIWPAADQPICHKHRINASSSPAAAAAATIAIRQQAARTGSCQEAFVRLSQDRRGVDAVSMAVAGPYAALSSRAAAAAGAVALGSMSARAGVSGPTSMHRWPDAVDDTAAAAHMLAATLPDQTAADLSGNSSTSKASPTDDCSDENTSRSSASSSRSPVNSRGRWHAQLGTLSYRMVVSYDGTAYSGWQLQSQARTIQGEIERALSTVLREDRNTLCVCAAGRTDAGVHAVGQVVQFMTNVSSIDTARLPYKLNSLLPHDIRVLWMSQTAPDFNVTVSAHHKTYHYNLDTGACHDPLRVRYSHHVRRSIRDVAGAVGYLDCIDTDAMQAAASLLVGTHDFTQFSNDSVERLRRNPIKTLQRFDVVQAAPNHVRLEVQGTGFLYKQVRHMVGVLLAVGQGKMGPQHIQHLLDIGNSQPPGANGAWRGYNVAPAKGLQLFDIVYPAEVDDPTTLLYPHLEHDEFGRLLSRIPGGSSVDEE